MEKPQFSSHDESILLYRSLVIPIPFYGCERWTLISERKNSQHLITNAWGKWCLWYGEHTPSVCQRRIEQCQVSRRHCCQWWHMERTSGVCQRHSGQCQVSRKHYCQCWHVDSLSGFGVSGHGLLGSPPGNSWGEQRIGSHDLITLKSG